MCVCLSVCVHRVLGLHHVSSLHFLFFFFFSFLPSVFTTTNTLVMIIIPIEGPILWDTHKKK